MARRNSLGRKRQPQTVGFVLADEASSIIAAAQAHALSESHGLTIGRAALIARLHFGEAPDAI